MECQGAATSLTSLRIYLKFFIQAAKRQVPCTSRPEGRLRGIHGLNGRAFHTRELHLPGAVTRGTWPEKAHIQGNSAIDRIRDYQDRETEQHRRRFGRAIPRLIRHAKPHGKHLLVKPTFEKHLVASYLGIRPESLSRNLAKLRDHGVQDSPNGIEITDPDALKKLVGEESLIFCNLPEQVG